MASLKNILLVYPEIPKTTYWSFSYTLPFIRKKSALPPLGLITVASLFPADSQLKLVDMNVEPLREKDIAACDAVFISAMIIQKDSMKQVIELCRKQRKPVIAGGPYPTTSYKEIEGVDHFVLGEVDRTFGAFLNDFVNGRAQKIYAPPERPSIEQLPPPRFDLLKMNSYQSMAVQFSRGCPFSCEFCDIWKLYGNRSRIKLSGTLLKEFDALFMLGWRGAVFVVDDNFIGNKREVKLGLLPDLLKWQKDHKFAFRFNTEASVNLADDEKLMAAMRDTGFNQVFLGIETPSVECLRETNKHLNAKTDLAGAVRKIQSFGIEVTAGFIVGFDNDTDDIFERQITFIYQTGIVQAMVGILMALPETDLYARLQKENRIHKEATGDNTGSLTTNFRTVMDSAKLKEGYKKILGAIYDRNLKNYFARCNRLLDGLGKSSIFQRDIGIPEIMTLIRSLSRQPFTRYGFQYLKYILRNAVRHPGKFAEVIRYSVIGHHFHTITQELLKTEKATSVLDEKLKKFKEEVLRYSQAMGRSSAGAVDQLTALWNQRRRMLLHAKKSINGIHEDFRNSSVRKYQEIAEQTAELFGKYGQEVKGE